MPELELLYLGALQQKFDEKNIQDANIGKYGVGRILDVLAELREKKWIELNKDGTFSITTSGRHLFWNDKMPLWLRILHVLEIKSFPEEEIAKYLNQDFQKIQSELEKLRKNGLVMITTIREESKIKKMLEILPYGKEELEKIQQLGFENADLVISTEKNSEIIELLEQVEKIINLEITNPTQKEKCIKNILKIKKRLGV